MKVHIIGLIIERKENLLKFLKKNKAAHTLNSRLEPPPLRAGQAQVGAALHLQNKEYSHVFTSTTQYYQHAFRILTSLQFMNVQSSLVSHTGSLFLAKSIT